MPELPEVETVMRGLKAGLAGRRIRRARAYRPDLRFPLPQDFAERLVGRRILGLGRRAKYILVDLDDGWTWLIHLGMSGSLRFVADRREKAGKHDHVEIEAEAGKLLRFNDPRRFGIMDLVPTSDLARHKLLKGLGVEPLSRGFRGQDLENLLGGRKTSVKAALLDQRLIVGIGNIYAAEALFRAGIDPRRKAGTIRGEAAQRLARAIKAVLREAIAAGGSSLRNYVQADGELGYFQHRWRVYDREGQACIGCDCDAMKTGGVKRIQQGGRSTFYCPRRQK